MNTLKSLFDLSQIDSTILSIAGFILSLALVAIYKMEDLKKGLLFLLYIVGSGIMIYIFVKYSFLSAFVVLFYIGHLLYNNTGIGHPKN